MENNSTNNNKKALMAAIMYVFNNFVIKAIGFLTVPIFSRMLSTKEYGIVSNFQSWASVLMIVFSLDLYSSIQRAKIDFKDKLDEYLSSILTLSSSVIIVVFVVTNLCGDFITEIFDLNRTMVNFLYIYLFFNCALDFYQMKHRVTLKYKQFTIISLTTSIASVILSLILINLMQDKANARIIGIVLPILIVSIFVFIKIMIKGKRFINFEYWKYGLKLSIPLIPHHLAANILAQSDKILITKQLGYDETALYSMGYNIPNIATIIWNALNNAWTPWFFEKMYEKQYEDIKKISKYYILVFAIFIVICLTVTPEIIKIIAPIEYQTSMYVVPPILLGVMCQMIYSLYVNIEFYYKKNYFIPVGTALSALLNIILNIIFIPIFGYIAAAYTTFIGYFLLFIMHYFIAKRFIDKNISLNDIFDFKFIVQVIIFVFLGLVLLTFLYRLYIIRYTIVLITITIILLIKKEEIIQTLKLIIGRKKQC